MRASLEVTRIYLLDLNRRHAWLIGVLGAAVLFAVPGLISSFGMVGFDRVSKDVGLSLLGILSVGAAILLGAMAVPQDVEKRLLYPLLSRPMGRFDYLRGKFIGIMTWVFCAVMLMGTALFAGASIFVQWMDPQILVATLVLIFQAGVIVAIAIFFSTFCSTVVAGVLTFFTFYLGGLSELYITWFLRKPSTHTITSVLTAFKNLLPNFDLFAVKNAVVHGEPLNPGYLAALAFYALGWMALMLVLSGRVFERKDL